MKFEIKETKNKSDKITKSLYISSALVEKVEKIAIKNDTSFNNVIVSMIEFCLKDEEEEK